MKRLPLIMLLLAVLVSGAHSTVAASDLFNLDSIAAKGKFPRFLVNTYRRGAEFFNGYDSLYVLGTGYDFNVKLRTESWTDYYNLTFDNRTEMSMISLPSTSAGIYLSYLALSIGYDMNVGKYLGMAKEARKRLQFGFDCMRFAAKFVYIDNDIGTNLTQFYNQDTGETAYPDLRFNGINNDQLTITLTYFLNEKRYSQAAAFNFSRLQIKSGGSFFAGLSYIAQNYYFNFESIPDEYRHFLPLSIGNNKLYLNSKNYFFKFGYAYNLVMSRHWLFSVGAAPAIGLTSGFSNDADNSRTRPAAYGVLKSSIVYNSGHWFAGMILSGEATLTRNSDRAVLSGLLNLEISAGYRFNLW